MTEDKTAKIYEETLQLLRIVIKRDFQPCNLENPLKTVLYDLTSKAANENWPGHMVIISGVFKAVKQTRSLAERYDKDLCHYLNMALKRGWIENWVLRFRRAMTQ